MDSNELYKKRRKIKYWAMYSTVICFWIFILSCFVGAIIWQAKFG